VTRAVVFAGTDTAVALNMPLLDPAATVTEVGTASAALLLESATAVELVTVALRPTVQLTCPGPVTLPAAQLNCDTVTGVGMGAGARTVTSVHAEVPFSAAVARAVVFVCTDAVATLNSALLDPATTVTQLGSTSAA
jgi:hypothetical protein